MAIFICPNCEQRSELASEDGQHITPHVCPHCGQEFQIDHEANVITEGE
jgi:DNA-directed RNA polymerase subunit RPC12/RpoP